jgi:hypothetical protein
MIGNMEVVLSFLSQFSRKWVKLLGHSVMLFARKRVKSHLISNVSVGNMLPLSYRLGRPALELML